VVSALQCHGTPVGTSATTETGEFKGGLVRGVGGGVRGGGACGGGVCDVMGATTGLRYYYVNHM
jgi:hypothetical protein